MPQPLPRHEDHHSIASFMCVDGGADLRRRAGPTVTDDATGTDRTAGAAALRQLRADGAAQRR